MFNLLAARARQGYQAIPDLKKALVKDKFRGFPLLDESVCGGSAACADATACAGVCPTGALDVAPLRIDLGLCVFCGDCQRDCPAGAVQFTTHHELAAGRRESLVVRSGEMASNWQAAALASDRRIRRLFGRSLSLRSVSAGGCNGCEQELNACSNANFDKGRAGISMSASPRHADGLVLTGPISANMAAALEDTWQAIPEPKLLILAGTCAISGGIFAGSPALDRRFLDDHRVDLFVPGCPVHPLTLINGILGLVGA